MYYIVLSHIFTQMEAHHPTVMYFDFSPIYLGALSMSLPKGIWGGCTIIHSTHLLLIIHRVSTRACLFTSGLSFSFCSRNNNCFFPDTLRSLPAFSTVGWFVSECVSVGSVLSCSPRWEVWSRYLPFLMRRPRLRAFQRLVGVTLSGDHEPG